MDATPFDRKFAGALRQSIIDPEKRHHTTKVRLSFNHQLKAICKIDRRLPQLVEISSVSQKEPCRQFPVHHHECNKEKIRAPTDRIVNLEAHPFAVSQTQPLVRQPARQLLA